MSGHTHAQNIRRKKAVIDQKRGKVFSRWAKLITVAARQGGGDPDANLSLKYAIDKARAANMPNNTIERAIKKGTGELAGASELRDQNFEGVGAGGVQIVVECLTDNKNRTAPEIRKIFEKGGGKIGSPGSAAWVFDKKGLVIVPQDQIAEDDLLELCLDAGADDVVSTDEGFELTCAPSAFEAVRVAIMERGLEPSTCEILLLPKSRVAIDCPKVAKRIQKLLDALEDHEDVQAVSSNEDIEDSVVLDD